MRLKKVTQAATDDLLGGDASVDKGSIPEVVLQLNIPGRRAMIV